MIEITEPEIGKGNERKCYVHPYDPSKAIKISYEQKIGRSKQTKIETRCYKKLMRRKLQNWKHLPRYFGKVDTNFGDGYVVELIRDFDGEVSQSLEYYLENFGIEPLEKELIEYRQYFLDHLIIFNYGMMPKNILRRRVSEAEGELVLIDGLGDVTHFRLPNLIPAFARRKIRRRWDKFANKYLKKYQKLQTY